MFRCNYTSIHVLELHDQVQTICMTAGVCAFWTNMNQKKDLREDDNDGMIINTHGAHR